ncbi:unnamed protein product [Sphagnum jensenii]
MPWLFVALLTGFLLIGPKTLLFLVSLLPVSELGNSGASIRAHIFLQCFAALLGTFAVAWILSQIARPSQLELSADGIKQVWLILGIFPIKSPMFSWDRINSISVERDPGKFDSRHFKIAMKSEDKTQVIKLSIGDLVSDEGRKVFADYIGSKAVKASIEPEVFELLTPQQALSFTEIWLEALSAPPNRERLIPISEGTLLNNRYQVEKRLGLGGQGTVYLAKDTETQCKVVLKETVLPVYADLITRKRALESFHKEAFALESVKNPKIATFLGSFVADHRAYLVLDYITGETLAQKINRDGALEIEKARSFGVEMCEILAVLHNLAPALVHRDFTPDNLMITETGNLILIDFAVSVSDDVDSEDVSGKPSYMAPEQLQGKPTIQSDIYSLGGTLYYLLTGDHPEPLNECWPMLKNTRVSDELNEVIKRCTKLQSKERFENVEAVRSSLLALKD